MPSSLTLMLFCWQIGLVDTFSLVQFCINGSFQYGAIVAASAAGNFSDMSIRVLFEPIYGLNTGYLFVRAAQNAAERRARIATLAAFLSTSASSAVTTDPATNAAIGGAIASKISYMRAMLSRGGQTCNITKSIFPLPSLKKLAIIINSTKASVLSNSHSYQTRFTDNSKIIISNIFQEHMTRRCLQGSAQKIQAAPNYLVPMASVSVKVNNTALIGWACFSFGLVSITILGLLYLFQRVERKRWLNLNQNDEVLIDVIHFTIQ